MNGCSSRDRCHVHITKFTEVNLGSCNLLVTPWHLKMRQDLKRCLTRSLYNVVKDNSLFFLNYSCVLACNLGYNLGYILLKDAGKKIYRQRIVIVYLYIL